MASNMADPISLKVMDCEKSVIFWEENNHIEFAYATQNVKRFS